MGWVRFTHFGETVSFGFRRDNAIEEYVGEMFCDPSPAGRVLPFEGTHLLSPCSPTKVIALWNNFHALSTRMGKQPPSGPLFLIKPSSAVCGHEATINRPKQYTGKIAFEGELGIVIGRPCKEVSEIDASRFIFGFTCVNDITATQWLYEDADFQQWTRAKGCDTFACIGPCIVQRFDWRSSRVVTRVNGVERQNYPLNDMILSPERQVSLISQEMTLLPGDVIAVGTSLGVGSLAAGALVEVSIEGIGTLQNTLATV
jgi:2-keto-4-pentenoate hydratase/2-oxohepta-3-ene-1,7-dioic acid hydratase in catechol pathway